MNLGAGRPPKEGEKRNRNRPTHDAAVLPAEGPSCPPPPPVCRLKAAGKRIWDGLWALPEATQWSTADVPALSRLVWLQQDPVNWADSRSLAEMRQLEDRFGLNPYSRRQLRWEKSEPEPSVDETSPGSERYGHLRAVEGA